MLVVAAVASACGSTDASPAPSDTTGGATSMTLPAPERLELVVAAETVECVGEGPQTCLVVQRQGSTEWEWFYDPIEGFDHVPGVTSRLLVERSSVADPPADGSSYRYRLLEVIDARPVDGAVDSTPAPTTE